MPAMRRSVEENQVDASCGLLVLPSTTAVSRSANFAPPSTQTPIATTIAEVAAAPTPVLSRGLATPLS